MLPLCWIDYHILPNHFYDLIFHVNIQSTSGSILRNRNLVKLNIPVACTGSYQLTEFFVQPLSSGNTTLIVDLDKINLFLSILFFPFPNDFEFEISNILNN